MNVAAAPVILLFLISCSSSEDELAKDKNVLEDKIGECDKEVKIIKTDDNTVHKSKRIACKYLRS